ncbi:MAG: hypothetical protein DRI57_02550 [Deltaproteobacteria bacterium]|nr:MAG: hypothetical protein DRI57_02550 [Deltaproteobacteria bacterium]
MLILKGVHGTTVARARKIADEGFSLSIGRRGSGAYFWRQGYHSRNLAVAWWKFCKERNIYSGDNNQNCAVIDAEISVKRAEYLSLEEHGIKDKIAVLAGKQRVGSDKRKIAKLYDFFIRKMEQKGKLKIRVVEIFLSHPRDVFVNFIRPRLWGIRAVMLHGHPTASISPG